MFWKPYGSVHSFFFFLFLYFSVQSDLDCRVEETPKLNGTDETKLELQTQINAPVMVRVDQSTLFIQHALCKTAIQCA